MSILIIKAGILTTFQDLGRNHFRRFGINQNGAMDKIAVRLINILLRNEENEAVLEMHYPAPEILFEKDTVFALGGANFGAKLNDRPLENWRRFAAQKGDLLKFEGKIVGHRAYLSVRGGFRLQKWLGSASTNLKARAGGFDGRKLQSGDQIDFETAAPGNPPRLNCRISNSLITFYSKFPTVRIIAGAEFPLLTACSLKTFFEQNFIVSPASDRMGFRLSGEPLFLVEEKELVSSAVNFGTIQLLPDGQMVILMADHQSSGGYPRIGNVCAADLPLLAQIGPHDKVAFHLISIEEAEKFLLEYEKDLNFLRVACRF